MTGAPTVFLVDDDEPFRTALSSLLESVGHRVESHAAASSFLDGFDPRRPGCVVADVRLPGVSGLNLQLELRRRDSLLPVILMSAYGDVETAVRAMKAGALDFLEKPFSSHSLLDLVREALSLDGTRRLERHRALSIGRRFATLTRRERQVMDAVVMGRLNKVIAADLGIAEKTVEVHRARMMKKMEVESVADLVRAYLVHSGGGVPGGRAADHTAAAEPPDR